MTCSSGTYQPSTGGASSSACLSCSSGTYALSGSSTCTSCQSGTFSPASGLSMCTPCPGGYFSNTLGSSICTACSGPGAYSVSGASVCLQCSAGSVPASGGASCSQCPGTLSFLAHVLQKKTSHNLSSFFIFYYPFSHIILQRVRTLQWEHQPALLVRRDTMPRRDLHFVPHVPPVRIWLALEGFPRPPVCLVMLPARVSLDLPSAMSFLPPLHQHF